MYFCTALDFSIAAFLAIILSACLNALSTLL